MSKKLFCLVACLLLLNSLAPAEDAGPPSADTANLTIHGLEPNARVWIDDAELPKGFENPLQLGLGPHKVAIWKDGRMPFGSTSVIVRNDGMSFVNWEYKAGHDRKRNDLRIIGLGLGSAGITLITLGAGFVEPIKGPGGTILSAELTTRNQIYVPLAGLFSVIAAVYIEIVAAGENRLYKEQKRQFGLLGGIK
jgi:hypothetical protein